MRSDLERYRDWIETTRKPIPEFRYQSYEALVLDIGRPFVQTESTLERGTIKECYSNALEVAMTNLGLYYCEGYAASHIIGIPLQHAWVCNEEGEAIEVTWPHENSKYFGVALDIDFVIKRTLKNGYYGLLSNDWLADNILLRDGIPDDAIPEQFRKEESR